MPIITISPSTSATSVEGFREIRVASFILIGCVTRSITHLLWKRLNSDAFACDLFNYFAKEYSDCQSGYYASSQLIVQALRKTRVCATAAPPRPAAPPVHPLVPACQASRFSTAQRDGNQRSEHLLAGYLKKQASPRRDGYIMCSSQSVNHSGY